MWRTGDLVSADAETGLPMHINGIVRFYTALIIGDSEACDANSVNLPLGKAVMRMMSYGERPNSEDL